MVFSLITKKLGGYCAVREKFLRSRSKLFRKIYSFLNRGYQLETNSYLPFDNTIKGPINFLHGPYGVFISGGSTFGKNCTIYQQVTIGSNMLIDSDGFGSPVIGDNCLIGAGAKVIGGVHVGDNCRIGANAVVHKDIPDNSVVVLASPRVYQKENLDNRIYQYSPSGWQYMIDGEFEREVDDDVIEVLNRMR